MTNTTLPLEIPTTAQATPQPDGSAIIERGPDLHIPADALSKIDRIDAEMRAEDAAARAAGKQECEQCGSWFLPRSGSGGRRQKYCGEECRRAADGARKANASNAGQREDEQKKLAALELGRALLKQQEQREWEKPWADPEDIVTEDHPPIPPIAIYVNVANKVVLLTEADDLIMIEPAELPKVIRRLSQLSADFDRGL